MTSQTSKLALKTPHIRPAKKRLARRERRGAGMLDSGLVLLLFVVVVAGLLMTFNGLMNSWRAASLQTQLTRAQAVIETAHGYSGIYANQSLLVFLSGEGFSDRELQRVSQGNYVFTSPFDTTITIAGNGARDFTITVADLPQNACEAAVMAFRDSGAGLDSASVGSTALALPLSEAAVAAACDNATNTVALTF